MAATAWMLWVVVHFLVGTIGTWIARRYALHRRLIDQPGERRAHRIATPRGGGIAIVAALLVAIAWLLTQHPSQAGLFGTIAAGLVLVAGAGWLDDHRPLSPWWRLLVHAVAAAGLAWSVHAAGGGTLVVFGSFGLALALVNIWNFMDGIDGLAASQALLVALAIAALAGGAVAWLAVALAAACAGFLPFNLPRARIFLGDVGSGALGYALAALIALAMLQSPSHFLAALLPLSAFIIDASLTLASRILGGARWWLPHAEHAYQRWTQRNGTHGLATFAYAAWTMVATVAMLSVNLAFPSFIIPMLAVTYGVGAVLWMRLRERPRGLGAKE